MTRIRNPRRGLTLTEVLVSIFILAIGLMALMSLFPIGALQMAQAMKDDRCAQDSANAERVFRTWWKQNYFSGTGGLVDPSGSQPAIGALANRNFNYPTALSSMQVAPSYTNYHGDSALPFATSDPVPSFPVLLDPIGIANNVSNANAGQYWVAGGAQSTRFVPRRDMVVVGTAAAGTATTLAASALLRFRYCALADEFTYDGQGGAGLTGAVVKREGTYNHAWLLQRLNNAVPYETNLQILVFRGRASTDTPNNESMYSATYTANSNVVTLTYTPGQKPNIRRNGWIMNASQYQVTDSDSNNTTASQYSYLRQLADFYRVVGVTETSTGSMDIELQVPVKNVLTSGKIYSSDATPVPIGLRTVTNPISTLITMENLVEVFDRGTISAFDKSAP